MYYLTTYLWGAAVALSGAHAGPMGRAMECCRLDCVGDCSGAGPHLSRVRCIVHCAPHIRL